MPEHRGTADVRSLIADIAALPGRLLEAVDGRSDADLDRAGPGEWPARTVLAHLRDDEYMVMRLRLTRMLVEPHPDLAPFDEKAWAANRNTSRDAPSELIEDFATHRAASVAIMNTLTPSDLKRTGHQPEIGDFDIHWWLEHWVAHDKTHLKQIEAVLG